MKNGTINTIPFLSEVYNHRHYNDTDAIIIAISTIANHIDEITIAAIEVPLPLFIFFELYSPIMPNISPRIGCTRIAIINPTIA